MCGRTAGFLGVDDWRRPVAMTLGPQPAMDANAAWWAIVPARQEQQQRVPPCQKLADPAPSAPRRLNCPDPPIFPCASADLGVGPWPFAQLPGEVLVLVSC